MGTLAVAFSIDDFTARTFSSEMDGFAVDNSASGEALQRHVPHDSSCDLTKSFHVVPSSLSPEHRMESEVFSRETSDRIIREQAPIHTIDERDFAELFMSALEVDYGGLKSKHKEIANDAGAASPKTAEAWTQGVSLPGFYKGLKLAAKSPTLAKEVVRLIAMDADLTPEFQEQFTKFMQMMGRS